MSLETHRTVAERPIDTVPALGSWCVAAT